MFNLKKIWTNKKEIFEGIKNSIIRDAYIESVSIKRMHICKECNEFDLKGSKCEVKGTQPCCGNCGCSLNFKTRSLSSKCPTDKWKALLTQQEEDKLNEL